ncbi:hypothetical protein [Ulvibacter sp. MAR_2010_11]|uniref:hypothetical protein n=1 Tax=Ulvibacter sp. MAR_2010_11 TaxID=1250229 RepID=UPI0012FDB499|nr:hypothetical protein [Ulvibacter sp. MAR_2010_11]
MKRIVEMALQKKLDFSEIAMMTGIREPNSISGLLRKGTRHQFPKKEVSYDFHNG